MKTPIDFGKDFLSALFDQRDAEACQKMLAGDLVWITPENMHHFLSEGAVLRFLRKRMKSETEARYVDLISIKSSPSAENMMTVAYEINLVSREDERPLYLRCSMVICRRGSRLEITFLHFSKKTERDSSEQLRAFIANLPCGVMILACLDGRREEAIFYNEYFAHRLRYRQDEFARAMAQNPFFMASEEDRDRIHEEIAGARKNGGSITVNLRFFRRDGNSFYYRMKGAPAYQADGGTVYYCVFQETTGFRITADRLRSRLDAATEILCQIPEALCGIEYAPCMPEEREACGSAGENPDTTGENASGSVCAAGKNALEEGDGDVKIYRCKGSLSSGKAAPENTAAVKPMAAKITGTGARVFFTSKNIPSMFGVSNSVYMKNILLDPFYGLEITGITRDRLLSSFILNPDGTTTGKAVSCGIFRVRRSDGEEDKAIRVELMIRRVKDKDGTMRLYLFYYDREAAQQTLESQVDRAMKMGRAGKEQLRADLRKAKENAARRQSESAAAMKEAEKKHAEELARVENSLAEEKKRGVLRSRQLEESKAAQKQLAAERDRIEEDASRRIRNHEARAQRQLQEACSARDLLEEQLRDSQERSLALRRQLQKEKSRRLLLEEQYRLLQEQNEELQKEQKGRQYSASLKIKETIGAAPMPDAVVRPPASPRSAAGAGASAVTGLRYSGSSGLNGRRETEVALDPGSAGSREGDWMTQREPVTVFSPIDPVRAENAEKRKKPVLPPEKGDRTGEDLPVHAGNRAVSGSIGNRAGSMEGDDFGGTSSSGQAVLRPETFSPEEFIREIMLYEENSCAGREIRLRLLIDSRLPAAVIGFAALLKRALCEIIESAIGHAHPGGTVSVHCRADRLPGDLVNLHFRVDDSGADIPGAGRKAAFRAQQAPDAAVPVETGLHAAEEAAALMGGSLHAGGSGCPRFSLTVALRVPRPRPR